MNKSSAEKKLLSLLELTGTSWLGSLDSQWLESKLEQYEKDPSQVEPEWKKLFDKLLADESWSNISYTQPVVARNRDPLVNAQDMSHEVATQSFSPTPLIQAFRAYGHLQANIDPLGLTKQSEVPELTIEAHDLSEAALNTEVELNGQLGLDRAKLSDIVSRLHDIYRGSIGFETQHISSAEERNWLSEQIECYRAVNTTETRKRILHRLLESDGLEKHLASQFVGQKRFSIEGADSLMPMLDTLVISAAEKNIRHINLGMAHRGRLNVLINLLGKPPKDLFKEFTGQYNEEDLLSGDVKYHKGFQSTLETTRGTVSVELAFNPSHLEVVNPVVEGMTRAKQDVVEEVENVYQEALPILIHGDAAFAGQGVVMETLQLSQTPAYTTGGTIHIVLNNQVGFTTDPRQARSTHYCTDIGKMIDAPIFHVNGNDPEAACRAIDLALGFRQTFNRDVIIDLVCYRRHGHNEGDEPAATQPLMYQIVRAQGPVWSHFAKTLQEEGIIQAGEAEAWIGEYRKRVSQGEPVAILAVESLNTDKTDNIEDWRVGPSTAVSVKSLKAYEKALTQLPEDMPLQPQVAKLMADRQKMLQGVLPLNWGTAETLAYASLLSEGFNIRLTGQDAERGTFAHRHAVLHHYKTGETYTPLSTLTKRRKQFAIYDSILSEMATMGFEYGYASKQPNSLVIWEAQYGDFVNGAQMVIDQFISSSEQKWGELSGLVLFLPHGYEGAGPEHSSARLERFLQLCAQQNIQVCAPTTPAQHFHLLRRQLLRQHWRKPLVVMTPKSLLRSKHATSELKDLSDNAFEAILPSQESLDAKQVKRIILCSGKVYYDLMTAKTEAHQEIAIVRIEQLYPFPDQELDAILKSYPNASDIIWCQEEPKNQGAWQWIRSQLESVLTDTHNLRYVGRPEAAATAVGSPLRHAAEQKALVQEALG